MPISDYQCQECSRITEHVTIGPMPSWIRCSCGKTARKIISLGSKPALTDPPWIHETVEVISRRDPDAADLRKHHTRAALNKYMNKKGLRFDEGNEPDTRPTKKEGIAAIKKDMLKALREHRRIEV